MFTKQHYITIAKILASSVSISEIQKRLIEFFASDNPRFNVLKFKEYVEKLKKEK